MQTSSTRGIWLGKVKDRGGHSVVNNEAVTQSLDDTDATPGALPLPTSGVMWAPVCVRPSLM